MPIAAETARGSDPGTHPRPENIPATIVVVDDDPTTLEMVQAALPQDQEFAVETFTAGADALDRVTRGDVALVISDWMMPGMDGIALLRAIRAADLGEYVYFVLLTARDAAGDVVEGLEAGADEFIPKPVRLQELKARIQSILRLRHLAREVELQNRELRRAQQLRNDWISMIMHDIRSPMTAILGHCDLLIRDCSSNQKSRLGIVKREAGRIHGMMEQMLIMAKSVDGQLRLANAEVDVETIARDALDGVASLASGRDISIEMTSAGEIRAEVDRSLIRRLLDNLLSNAIRYSPAGSMVSVSLDASPRFLEISVRDQGRGVPPEAVEKIFGRYESIGRSTVGGGQHGLGLAFCRLVAEAHGGTIVWEPNDPCGSCFRLRLPHRGR